MKVQDTKYKRKWEVQSSKDEQRPASPKLCTLSFVPRTLNFPTIHRFTWFFKFCAINS